MQPFFKMILLLVLTLSLWGADETTAAPTKDALEQTAEMSEALQKRQEEERIAREAAAIREEKIRRLQIDLRRSNEELTRESIWTNSYSSYLNRITSYNVCYTKLLRLLKLYLGKRLSCVNISV